MEKPRFIPTVWLAQNHMTKAGTRSTRTLRDIFPSKLCQPSQFSFPRIVMLKQQRTSEQRRELSELAEDWDMDTVAQKPCF